MGKNQAYKAMQRARLGGASAGPDEVEDGMVDGSFHSPEWHAARLASLNTSHTITWEEFKKKQKEEEMRKGELEADADRMMREYRAQLDAERARKLSQGRNHSGSKSKRSKGVCGKVAEMWCVLLALFPLPAAKGEHCMFYFADKRDRISKKHSSKKRKHTRRSSSSSSSSSSSDSSSGDEERVSRRSKSRSKRSKKEKKLKSRTKDSGTDDEDDGPVRLSKFFGSVKS